MKFIDQRKGNEIAYTGDIVVFEDGVNYPRYYLFSELISDNEEYIFTCLDNGESYKYKANEFEEVKVGKYFLDMGVVVDVIKNEKVEIVFNR